MDSLFQEICALLHGIENYHDTITNRHECRTGKLMSILGKAYGMNETDCTTLNIIGSIHDIGKIAISQEILEKPGPLTDYERNIMELHPMIGYSFIKKIKHPLSELAGMVILTHHENYDGSGYPNKLKGDEIPIEGAMCTICDVYDALRDVRRYKDKKTHREIFHMMSDNGPRGLLYKFNPTLLKIFMKCEKEINDVYD